MKDDDLKEFLLKAKRAGYAAGGESAASRMEESDGSKSTRFQMGDLKFHDNWFGGEPYGGREVVHYLGKPYWMMVYYGEDDQNAPGAIPLLLKALSNLPEDFPVRGPRILEDGDYRYENSWSGDILKFSGEEKIYFKEKQVYFAKYQGGLVDQRAG